MSSLTGSTGLNPSTTSTGLGNSVPSGYKLGRIQNFTPEQMQLFGQLFGNVGQNSYLGRLAGGDQSQFEEAEAPALRQFGQLQGQLASRFSGQGLGGRQSSGFRNSGSAAASDFAQQLQSRRMDIQRQAIMDLHGLSNDLLGQRPYDQFLVQNQQKQPSFGKQLLGSFAGGAGQALGSSVTGGLGALGGSGFFGGGYNAGSGAYTGFSGGLG